MPAFNNGSEQKFHVVETEGDESENSRLCNARDDDSPRSGSLAGLSKTKSMYSLTAASLQSSLVSGTASDSSADDIKTVEIENLPNSFGRDVREYTDTAPDSPTLDSGLRKVLEPHLRVARKQRDAARREGLGGSSDSVQDSIANSMGVPYTDLRKASPFLFSEETQPLNQILANCLNIKDLSLVQHVSKEELLLPLLRKAKGATDGGAQIHTNMTIPHLPSRVIHVSSIGNMTGKLPIPLTLVMKMLYNMPLD